MDAPVTITERDLRSLRSAKGVAIFALILALLTTGAFAYAMVAGPDEVREKLGIAQGSGTEMNTATPVASASTSVAHSDSLGLPPPAADSVPPPDSAR